MAADDPVIEHPNRRRAASKIMKVLIGIFAAIAARAWFDRDKPGFNSPALPEDVLGLLCVVLVPLQAALIVASLQGFRQAWNVEVERPGEPRGDAEPAAA